MNLTRSRPDAEKAREEAKGEAGASPAGRLLNIWLGWLYGALVVVGIFNLAIDAAEIPPSALSKPQLIDISFTPVLDQNNELESMTVVAKYRKPGTRPDGRTVIWETEVITFKLLQEHGKSVVLGNSIVKLRDLGTDVMDLSDYVWKEKYPALERKRLREPGTAK